MYRWDGGWEFPRDGGWEGPRDRGWGSPRVPAGGVESSAVE